MVLGKLHESIPILSDLLDGVWGGTLRLLTPLERRNCVFVALWSKPPIHINLDSFKENNESANRLDIPIRSSQALVYERDLEIL